MLPKDINSSRRPRVAQNSSVSSTPKGKNCVTQTPKFDFAESGNNFIAIDGKISKNDQNNYKKAVDFVNKWNDAMNEYLKKGSRKGFEDLNFTPVPNYMSFFVAVQEVHSRYSDTTKAVRKNSYSQTKFSQERIVVDVTSQTRYVKSTEGTIEDPNDIPKKIQLAQYGTYPQKTKNLQKTPSYCPPLKNSARFSESNIRQTEQAGYNSKAGAMNSLQNSPVRQNQSFANFADSRKRPPTGLLSPNGMIASEINANGTPIIVRGMFENVQNPVGVFVSQGNILKNISRSGSSGSSVILSDKDSGELKIEDSVERISSPYYNEKRYPSFLGGEEEDPPTKHHPLNLNERDLNSRDKNFISSIGIFTEAGELKANAKTYLETKDDVRKGTFRAPRLSQLHMTQHYKVKSCTSDSLLSDIVSEFDE